MSIAEQVQDYFGSYQVWCEFMRAYEAAEAAEAAKK